MTEKMGNPFNRTVVLVIVIGFILGIGLGLVMGWWVWPVSWHDTDPSDLRLAHQQSYVRMVADSLLVTEDINLAKQRLFELLDDDTSWAQVANLVEQVAAEREKAGDAAEAVRVRRLAQAVNLPSATAAPFTAPKKRLIYTSDGLLYLIGFAALIAALAIIVWFLMRRAPSRQPRVTVEAVLRPAPLAGQPQPARTGTSLLDLQGEERNPAALSVEPQEEQVALEAAEPVAYELPPQAPTLVAAPAPRSGPSAIPAEEVEEPEEALEEEVAAPLSEEAFAEETPAEEPLLEEEEEEQTTIGPTPRAAPQAALGADIPPDALGVFEAEYTLGNDDFDCSFSIESAQGDFLGECGLGIADVLRADDAQQVDAFEVWLFDKGDIRTVSKILVSEWAYEDEATNARLSAKGELVVAEPGLTITLETLSLQVTATVKGLRYVADTPEARSCFAQLNVELLAERSDALP